ncbi:hypothetical protein Zmor_019076 [Zophobas morio]|jgi:hypothetical protein|uniref:Dermonecrotic toxin N-terminal domain-containing protein n=1 Tax=Zophobas morio TaxID=2755281 RepID=A0AA38HKQ5_9CUCU|nr:hypothetical protein Zmor_019076 [Zophobas morio]
MDIFLFITSLIVFIASQTFATNALSNQTSLKGLTTCLNNYTAYLTIRKKVVNEIPNLYRIAKRAIRKKLYKRFSYDVNPDTLYLTYLGPPVTAAPPYLLAHNGASGKWSVTLTGAVLIQFHNIVKEFNSRQINSQYVITYDNGSKYDGNIRPTDLRDMVREVDFTSLVEPRLKIFWNKHKENWRTLVKAEFIRAARVARKKGILSELDYKHLLEGLAPEVSLNKPVTLEQIQKHERVIRLEVRYLDINGYLSSDILRVLFKNGKIIIYFPSIDKQTFYQFTHKDYLIEDYQVLYIFNSDIEMREWLVDQVRDQRRRFLFACHFSLYDREDGKIYTGVDSSLKKLAEGEWKLTGNSINFYNYIFSARYWKNIPDSYLRTAATNSETIPDVFETIACLAEFRSLHDAVKVLEAPGKILQDSTLFYYKALNLAADIYTILYGPIGAASRLRNFSALLGFKSPIKHTSLEEGEAEILYEMKALFSDTTPAIGHTDGTNFKTHAIYKKPQSQAKHQEKQDFYEDLAAQFPDLNEQLKNPDPLIVAHDQSAIDDLNHYLKDEHKIIDFLFKSNIVYTNSENNGYIDLIKLNTVFNAVYSGLKDNITFAYRKSPTFRRLFNYARNQELQNEEKRWGIKIQLGPPIFSVKENNGVKRSKLLVIYAEENQLYYQSGPCLVPFSKERSNLREVVKVLTLFTDNVSEAHPRGPVVEYTNIILKEMNLAVPTRTRFYTNISDYQLAISRGQYCINYAVYLQLRSNVTSSIPNFTKLAHHAMRSMVKEWTGLEVDPNKVYLNYFGKTPKEFSADAYLKWTRNVQPQWSITLTTLAFCNFNNADMFREANKLNEEYGVYSQGAGSERYGVLNEIKIQPSVLRDIVWQLDFYSVLNRKLNEFWKEHYENWRILAKAEFYRSALYSKNNGILSEDEYIYILRGLDPELPLNESITIHNLQKKWIPSIDVRRLDINGYTATDILRFVLKNGREILYIPGGPQAFYAFDSDHKLREWLVSLATNLEKRFMLASHFSAYNRQDGNTYTGVDNALQKLVEGDWSLDGSGINYYNNSKIKVDVFDAVAAQTRERKFQDADTLVFSDSELCEQRLKVVFQIAAMYFNIPLMLAGPIGALINTLLFSITLGLEIHIASEGDSAELRESAKQEAEMDVGMATMFGAISTMAGRSINYIKRVSKEVNLFNAPKLINNKLGYLLSPEKPPRLPETEENPKIPEVKPSTLKTLPRPFTDFKVLKEFSDQQYISKTYSDIYEPFNLLNDEAHKIEVQNFYKSLYEEFPELGRQLRNPDPSLLLHDKVATDTTDRFLVKNDKVIIESFIKNKYEINYFDYLKQDPKRWKKYPYEYNLLSRIMTEAYHKSPTFRRLYNYALDSELLYSEKRWLIAPREAFRTTITEDELSAAKWKRTIGLNIDFVDCRYYEADNNAIPFTVEHAYINEVVRALTGINFKPDELNIRGPIVEYTNIILKEVGRDITYYRSSIRTNFITLLSNEQLATHYHYKTLATSFPELRIQTENPDPYLLDHDRVAVDNSYLLSPQKCLVVDLMFKKGVMAMEFNNEVSPSTLVEKAPEYKLLKILIEKAYYKSSTFRRLFNYAFIKYNWEKAENRVIIVPSSRKFSCITFSKVVTEDGYLYTNPKSKQVLFLDHEIDIRGYVGIENTVHKSSLKRVYMHEVVHVLTNLPDVTTVGHPRGPVVEYTNYILLEMGLQEPVRMIYNDLQLDIGKALKKQVVSRQPEIASFFNENEERLLCKSPFGEDLPYVA